MEKKKYWIKLEKDFLNSSQIKVIKNMQNGKDYIIFYLALMLESTNTEGHLRFSELVPYNEEMLASVTDTNVDIVRSAMKVFQSLGLIQVLENGTIFLPDVPKRVGKECDSAERVRLFRERQDVKKIEMLQCNTDVTKCNNNKDKNKNKDKDKDIYIAEQSTATYKEIIDYLNEKAGTKFRYNSQKTKDKIKARLNEKYTVEDFKKVIDNKCACWRGTDMEKYLRPETLFGGKFESYLNEKQSKKEIMYKHKYDKMKLENLLDSFGSL